MAGKKNNVKKPSKRQRLTQRISKLERKIENAEARNKARREKLRSLKTRLASL